MRTNSTASMIALVLLQLAGCGHEMSPAEQAARLECRQYADGLATVAAHVGAFAAMPDGADLYARAGRLWLLEHERSIESIVVRDEETTLAAGGGADAIARDPARAAALQALLDKHRATVAALDGRIADERRSASDAGYPELDDDGGAGAVLEAAYWRKAAAHAATLQTRCQSAPASLAKGEVAGVVLDAYAAAGEINGRGHDVVTADLARRYAPATVQQ